MRGLAGDLAQRSGERAHDRLQRRRSGHLGTVDRRVEQGVIAGHAEKIGITLGLTPRSSPTAACLPVSRVSCTSRNGISTTGSGHR